MTRRPAFQIGGFEPGHVAEAAALVGQRVALMRRDFALVPERWADPQAYVERLTELVENHPAAVALADGKVVGFMAGKRFEWTHGRWAFSPEWANCATGPDAGRIREELYATLAEQWVADDRRAHFVSLLPTDSVARETMGWLGFGTTNVDGLRDLSPVEAASDEPLQVRRATRDDADKVALLEQGLRDHLASTPLFLRYPTVELDQLNAKLADTKVATLLATDSHGPLAYLRIGPASSDASTIIRDAGTASITGAFTRADRRGEGVARTMLDAALAWARHSGYIRCAVDFESANLLASRFWPLHFQVVGITVGRRL